MAYTRRASHAGPNGSGWYDSAAESLRKAVEGWMVPSTPLLSERRLLGLIAPHAGLRCGGPTAGKAYAVLRDYLRSPLGSQVETVFLLGPSHHKAFVGVEVSAAAAYDTPLGPLPVHQDVVRSVTQRCRSKHVPVSQTTQSDDEREHSLELQLPFIAAAAGKRPLQLVPIIVGQVNREMEESLCDALHEYLADPRYMFVFSSDFCHWGERFGYTYLYKTEKAAGGVIADAIEAMDRRGVELLAARDVDGWYRYLKETDNTICGRHPISIGMHYWAALPSSAVHFQGYSQSNRVVRKNDGSVSYASVTIYA